MLPTVTNGGAGTGTVTALLVVGVVVTATAALVGLVGQHRGESARDRRARGTPAGEGAGRRSARRLRTLGAVALVDVWALGLGVLVLTGATSTSQPLLVGLVCGTIGCATLGGAVAALGSLLPRAGADAEPVVPSGRQVGRAQSPATTATRPLAAVPPPGADGPGTQALSTSGTRGLPATRERAAARARRHEERERRRSQDRRQTVSALESVLGRGAGAAPRPADRAPARAVVDAAGPRQDVPSAAPDVVAERWTAGGRRARTGAG